MKVGRSLPVEGAVRRLAFLRRPKSLETLLDNSGILPVIVGVHLYIRCTDVRFITAFLFAGHRPISLSRDFLSNSIHTYTYTTYVYAMIVGLLSVVLTVLVFLTAVVHGRVPHESVLKTLIPFLMPFEVPDHLFLLHEDSRIAIQAVKVLPVNQFGLHPSPSALFLYIHHHVHHAHHTCNLDPYSRYFRIRKNWKTF